MNTKEIEHILQLVKDFEIAELEFEREGAKLVVKKYPSTIAQNSFSMPVSASPVMNPLPSAAQTNPQGNAPAAEVVDANVVDITSPIVGTFYSAASPESPPFVSKGKNVTTNDTICIIEAMKVMNEIKSEINGTVVDVLVQNGQSVEFGQVLFKVKKS